MKPYLLAIDIGTSGVKLLLLHGEISSTVIELCENPTHCLSAGWAQQDPEDWWNAICNGIPRLLGKARVSADEIAAIGVDGMSWIPVAVDAQGEVLTDAPLWYDTRATEECRAIARTIGEEAIFETCGNPLQPYYLLPKLMWMRKHESDKLQNLRRVLTSNGYVVFKLTGQYSQDESQAYGWPFFRTGGVGYDETMAETLGFDLDWLDQPCRCTQVIGEVTTRAAEASGLCAGIPVVAGGLDAACGALGAGVYDEGPVHEQSGSAGGMSICTRQYQPVKGLIVSRHVVPERWLTQGGTVGGGASMRWLCDVLSPFQKESVEPAKLSKLSADVAPGADGLIFLPYMAGERSPIWDSEAKGVFFGLDYSKTTGHLAKAVMEGAALALRHNLEVALDAGVSLECMRAVGGASRSEEWMQIKADVTGYPIQAVAGGEATGVGCAIVAGVGTGVYPSFEQACRQLTRLNSLYWPREAYKSIYAERYEQYLELYTRLAPLMKGRK